MYQRRAGYFGQAATAAIISLSILHWILEGNPQAIDDICGHWLFGHTIVARSQDRVHCTKEEKTDHGDRLLDELALYTQAPYYLLSLGGKIRVGEPAELKACLVDITSSLLEHYQA